MKRYDVAIVGAGIVGASIAYHLAPRLRVLLLEAESAAGYHSTGRSAALYTEAYGPPCIRALTRASGAFFQAPPSGFAAEPLLRARGALYSATEEQRGAGCALHARLVREGIDAEILDGRATRHWVPVLREEASVIAIHDRRAADIDVDLLLQGLLRGARGQGAQFAPGQRVGALDRDSEGWRVGLAGGANVHASRIVNAAGAWADEVAALAGVTRIGLEPRRRSAFLFQPPAGIGVSNWPAVLAMDESWYFKPDAGLLLGSPANADPVAPHDVVAEEFDVALGIHGIESATTMTIGRPIRTWAGLRSFVADGEPVCGYAATEQTFFWAAALGGYGIQTAPAFGQLCAALISGDDVPDALLEAGVMHAAVSPLRPGLAAT
jgi:D-arginine dehydrogenase